MVINKNKALINQNNTNMITHGLLKKDWKSTKIVETSVSFVMTPISNSRGYRGYEIMHEETKTSNQYNHLYITEELCQILDSSTSTWNKLIPGHTEDFQKTTKVVSPSNCKKIIPSYELFLLRKLLHKQTKNRKDL